jgi:two-component system sensor histidine kinase/response regulator
MEKELQPPRLTEARNAGHVLVVDDEALIRTMLVKYLRRQGYEVRAAQNGAEALALVEQALPDVVIVDIYMPGMNGVEVLRALRARQYRGTVIALTASQDEKLLLDMLEFGSMDVMNKPVNLERLGLAVQVGLAISET